jgi:riboflavin kinase / FMN adenylyltransferase
MNGLEELAPPAEGSAVVIGTFDGVHAGHRSLIRRAVAYAGTFEARSVCVTWDRHPTQTLAPLKVPPLLTSPARKEELLEATGVDALAILPFHTEFTRWEPERFVRQILVEGLRARAVFVGEGFRFGHRASGDSGTLLELGRRLGFSAHSVPLLHLAGARVSSTRIRTAVAEGDVETASLLLGRPFDLDGMVVRGNARGAALGYPTANLDAIDPALARPRRGIYAGCAGIDGTRWGAAISVGTNPTFSEGGAPLPERVEAHLIDFAGDLYGRRLRVEFWRRLRDELKFDSPGDLVAQMDEDVRAARQLTCYDE